MPKTFIAGLKEKQPVDSAFLLLKKIRKLTKQDKPYLELTFSDKTGKIEARLWDNADSFLSSAETGDIVRVKGEVSSYRDENQIKVDSIERIDDELIDHSDFVKVAEGRDEIMKNIKDLLKSIKNPWISRLASGFLEDKDFMDKFYDSTGAKSWHNAYVGGLMEHTYEVIFIAKAMSDLYQEIDKDIAIFGAFLHDIGKVYELDTRKMEYTVEGGLVGHIAIGYKLLNSKISEIAGFPGELAIMLEHIILSHHGKYEQQSPVLPKTLESTVIYHADELVSQANAIKEIKASQSGSGKIWSDYVNMKSRKYFLKNMREDLRTASENKKDPGNKALEDPKEIADVNGLFD